jgi:CheY-like chemotaxis protein/HPt (histidine-containing phosphotransfer) domain-containing protein
MPDMDGLSLARAIREREYLKEIALIMLTSIEDQVCGDELRHLGFSGYLIKPVGQSQLFNAISNAVRKTGTSAEPSSQNVTSTPLAAPATPLEGLHVLLAEDNEINQMVATAILTKVGVTCDIVDNGIRAVEAAMTGCYDLVLMDCQMPEMDGFEAAREIRRRETTGGVSPENRIPIVALTANAIKGDREQCLQAGMDDYLAKPIDIEKLCAVLRSMLTRARHHREAQLPTEPAAKAGDRTHAQTHAAVLPAISSAVAHFLQAPGNADAPLVPDPAASKEMPPLNIGELCARCANDIEFTQRLLHKFQDRVADDLAALARNITERKLDEATRLAHSLKGSAANLAAPAVRAVAAEIEAMGRAGDVSQAQDALQRLQREVDRCLAYIPQAIASLNSAPPSKPCA